MPRVSRATGVAPVYRCDCNLQEGEATMAKVPAELSMSLDGYIAGPDVSPEEPMGRGGEALHECMFRRSFGRRG